MKKIQLGLIGLGYIGKLHLINCLKLNNAKLTSVCDLSSNALQYAKERGVKKRYKNYHKMLKKEDLDAIIVALPNFLHKDIIKEIAEANKHILVEKPLAINVDECNEIIQTINKQGIKLMVGYPLRFSTIFQNLKTDVDAGDLGDVQNAHAVLIGSGPFLHRAERGNPAPVPDWWFNKELSGGGVLLDLGCHLINLLHWYFGDVLSIKSSLGYRFNLNIEDHALLWAKFKSGTIANINVGWYSQRDVLKIDMYGTLGHRSVYRKPTNKIITALQMLIGTETTFLKPYVRELNYFVECIINDVQPKPSAEEAKKDLETIYYAYNNILTLE